MALRSPHDPSLLREVLGRSTDQALLRVIELIDTLPNRPDRIEELISASRPRLRTLRPGRALNFGRLLFLPVEGAICAGEGWMAGEATIPRRTLSPIASALRDAMGPVAAEIDAALADGTAAETDAVRQTALRLWSAAAQEAPGLTWQDADTATREERRAVARLCAGVWAQAPLLWPVLGVIWGEAPDDAVRRAVGALRPLPDSATVLIATLIGRAGLPGRIAMHAHTAAPGMLRHIEHALDQWIERAGRAMAEAGSQREGELIEAFAAAMDDMAEHGWLDCAERRDRAQRIVGAITAAAPGQSRRQANG